MAIRKRANLWQIDVTVNGQRIRVTEKTRAAAQVKERELLASRDPQLGASAKKSGKYSPRLHPSRIQKAHGTGVVQ